jgi:phosphoribosylanthranilate isomerase
VSIFVKICGIRDPDTAAAAADAGANAIGFVFAESARKVTAAEARDAAAAIPVGIKRVAVMKHPLAEDWEDVLHGFEPDVLQTDIGDFASLEVPARIRKWPVIREGDAIAAWPDVFVYEGQQSGAGQTVDWQSAREAAANGNMILAGGLNAGNVVEAISVVQPWGVDVSSGVESQPGQKDAGKIREFISAVRAAEKEV